MLKAIALKFSIAWDLLVFLWNFKMWWMIPMVSILLFFGLFRHPAPGSAGPPLVFKKSGSAGTCRRDFFTKRYGFRRGCPLFLKTGFVGSDPRKKSLGADRRLVYTGDNFLRCGSVLGLAWTAFY